MTDVSPRFEQAIKRIDAANAEDPNTEAIDGESHPKCLVYGRRMSACLTAFAPDAEEVVQIAARAQHIRRWAIPRDNYPRDRAGYHAWRSTLYRFHADETAAIMQEVGYDDASIESVRDLLRKKRLKADANMQLLEDVICLVFLEHYFDEFLDEHRDEEDKIIRILQRTWAKMSDAGHDAAMALPLSDDAKRLVSAALS